MPRISDDQREARREQILDAALACVQEHGLEAVSMEMIIAKSGLSTGAVYRYFKGKDEIINAAVRTGTAGLVAALATVLANPDPPPLPEFIEQVLGTSLAYGRHLTSSDRLLVAVHGWSHSQSDPELNQTVRGLYAGLRDQFAEVVKKWQASGVVDPKADPSAIAQLLLTICMGYVAQRVVAGGTDLPAHVAALETLFCPRKA